MVVFRRGPRKIERRAVQARSVRGLSTLPLSVEEESAILCSVFRHSPDGMAFIDSNLVIRAANESFAKAAGASLGDIVGHSPEDVLPAQASHVKQICSKVGETGRPFHAEAYRLVLKDRPKRGVRFWDVSISPLYGANGGYLGSLLLCREVTERERMREENERLICDLNEANEQLVLTGGRALEHADEADRYASQLKALLESIGDGVTILDSEGRVQLRNQAAREILGLFGEPGEPDDSYRSIGDDIQSSASSPLEFANEVVARVLSGEQVSGQDVMVARPDGSMRRIILSGSAIRDEQGSIEMAIFVYRDVTELRRLEQMRQEYLSLISHDLRNPLTVIHASAQALERATGKARWKGMERQFAADIVKAAWRMNAMIQDLVDSAKLEAGQLPLDKSAVNLQMFVPDVLSRAVPAISRGRVEIDIPADLPAVEADAPRLERILTNLLSNALKYSPPESKVSLRAERAQREVTVSVADRGVGIAPEDLPQIFGRFYRSKSAEKSEGSGLGLYITRMLVEAHGGRICAESKVGEGSTFYFTLPLA